MTSREAIEHATDPAELRSLARDLRAGDPEQLPLALRAAERAIELADAGEDRSERVRARASLVAALRLLGRAEEAIPWAREATGLAPGEPVGWTVLIAATRQARSPGATACIYEAIDAVGMERLEADGYFCKTAAAAAHEAGDHELAAFWFGAAIRGVERSPEARREDVLGWAESFVGVLRGGGAFREADALEALVAAARRPAAAL
jgi:tetratricopeptide (TPR) repeat protein